MISPFPLQSPMRQECEHIRDHIDRKVEKITNLVTHLFSGSIVVGFTLHLLQEDFSYLPPILMVSGSLGIIGSFVYQHFLNN